MPTPNRQAIRSIRYIVLISQLLLAGFIYLYWQIRLTDPSLFTLPLAQTYGIWSLILLYLTLLISPATELWPTIPYKALIIRSRRALGVSAFVFAFLHGNINLFVTLGGPSQLKNLPSNYFLAVLLGLTALWILTFLAATSFDKAVTLMGRWWKQLHRLVYLAGWLILFHAFLLGSHFADRTTWPSIMLIIAIILLLALEVLRLIHWSQLRKRAPRSTKPLP